MDSENRGLDNSADGVMYQCESKGHKPVKAAKAARGNASPAVLSIMQTPNGTRKVMILLQIEWMILLQTFCFHSYLSICFNIFFMM